MKGGKFNGDRWLRQPNRELLSTLLELKTREQKTEHTRLELGADAGSADAVAFATLMRAMHLAWVHEVPLMMSA